MAELPPYFSGGAKPFYASAIRRSLMSYLGKTECDGVRLNRKRYSLGAGSRAHPSAGVADVVVYCSDGQPKRRGDLGRRLAARYPRQTL
jgi:hypothetical protein